MEFTMISPSQAGGKFQHPPLYIPLYEDVICLIFTLVTQLNPSKSRWKCSENSKSLHIEPLLVVL